MAEPPPEPTWFMVKYGEDESAPFNSDCWAVVLLDHMKAKCGYPNAPEEFDLLSEDGQRLNLLAVGKESAIASITPKSSYILAKIVVDEESGAETVEQLWTPPEGYEPPAAAGKGAPAKGKK